MMYLRVGLDTRHFNYKRFCMNIENLTIDDSQRIYDYYLSGNYKIFFRQFPAGLNWEDFRSVLTVFGGMVKCIDDGKNLGYAICPFYGVARQMLVSVLVPQKHQQKGNALKIMKFLATKAFNEFNANRIVCLSDESDVRTNSLLEKAGFLKEGTLYESAFYDNEFHNEVRWSMNKATFEKIYGGLI